MIYKYRKRRTDSNDILFKVDTKSLSFDKDELDFKVARIGDNDIADNDYTEYDDNGNITINMACWIDSKGRLNIQIADLFYTYSKEEDEEEKINQDAIKWIVNNKYAVKDEQGNYYWNEDLIKSY